MEFILMVPNAHFKRICRRVIGSCKTLCPNRLFELFFFFLF
uniref:Uncharacterized protein n=1 Tax=Rhizophora mucronata TaxID=61149 RepID=A0A2P2QEE2_RHIMU